MGLMKYFPMEGRNLTVHIGRVYVRLAQQKGCGHQSICHEICELFVFTFLGGRRGGGGGCKTLVTRLT
jgi:hypothetical protein